MSTTEAITSCQCWAVITDPQRASKFSGVFPSNRIPIDSPVEHIGELGPGGKWVKYYRVDPTRVTPDQEARLISALAAAFQRTEGEIKVAHRQYGIPVLASSVVFSRCRVHRDTPNKDPTEHFENPTLPETADLRDFT